MVVAKSGNIRFLQLACALRRDMTMPHCDSY